MSRQYTTQTEGLDYHRRSNHGRESAAEYPSRASPRACPISRASPQQDTDSEKGDQPRRRIGLACSRCRKRKIKCSGDTGGGCKSCKAAGVEECNFLRVNSFAAPSCDHGLEYPYSNASTHSLPVAMPRTNSNTSSFYAGDFGMMQSSAAYPNTTHRNPPGNGHYPSVTARHSHPSMTSSYSDGTLNDEVYEHYTQAPNYMLPAQDQQSSAAYPTHEMPRQWTPIAANGNRPSTLSFEHDASYRYAPSNFPYINSSSTLAMGPNDSLFPDMNALSRGLPQHRDRTLPNPRRTSISMEAGSNSYQNSGESSSYGPPGLSHKSSVAWGPQTQTRGGSQGSISSNSVSAFSGSINGSVNGSVSGPVGGSMSSSPPVESSNQTTAAFGYMPLSTSPLHQAVSIPRPSEMETVNSTTGNKYRSLAQMPSAMPYSLGQTSLAYRGPPTANHYGYSMASHKPHGMSDNTSSDHTLVNGETYHRLRQPPVKHNPLEPLPLDKPPPISITPKGVTATTAQQSRHR